MTRLEGERSYRRVEKEEEKEEEEDISTLSPACFQ